MNFREGKAFNIALKLGTAFSLFKHTRTGALIILPEKSFVRQARGHVPTRLPYRGLTLILGSVSYEAAIWFARGMNHGKDRTQRAPWLVDVVEKARIFHPSQRHHVL